MFRLVWGRSPLSAMLPAGSTARLSGSVWYTGGATAHSIRLECGVLGMGGARIDRSIRTVTSRQNHRLNTRSSTTHLFELLRRHRLHTNHPESRKEDWRFTPGGVGFVGTLVWSWTANTAYYPPFASEMTTNSNWRNGDNLQAFHFSIPTCFSLHPKCMTSPPSYSSSEHWS